MFKNNNLEYLDYEHFETISSEQTSNQQCVANSVSGVMWEVGNPKTNVTKNCPIDNIGNITRYCNNNGLWDNMNYNCSYYDDWTLPNKTYNTFNTQVIQRKKNSFKVLKIKLIYGVMTNYLNVYYIIINVVQGVVKHMNQFNY